MVLLKKNARVQSRGFHTIFLVALTLSFMGNAPFLFGDFFCNNQPLHQDSPITLASDVIETVKSPLHWNSSWIGNQWIAPAGYKLISALEMRDYLSNHSILFIGDSTARRQYTTLYATLNASQISDITLNELNNTNVIDVNKYSTNRENSTRDGYTLFRELPSSSVSSNNDTTRYYSALYEMVCLDGWVEGTKQLQFLQSEMQQMKYAVVVIVFGPWELSQKFECKTHNIGRYDATVALIDQLKNWTTVYPNTKFVWRTWAGPGTKNVWERGEEARSMEWKNSQGYNHFIKSLIHNYQREQHNNHGAKWNAISYIDWGMVMGPRSFPHDKRIKGDIPYHVGFEARATFDQMLINHLIELDRQETLNLAPSTWVMEKDDSDSADDCLHAGFPPYYCVSKEEINYTYQEFLTRTVIVNYTKAEREQLVMARDDFCDQCKFDIKGGISCGYRLMYMRGNYKMDELPALLAVMKSTPSCNKTAS